jgi:hypothetical protein
VALARNWRLTFAPIYESVVSHSLFISSLGKSEAEPLDMGSQAEPGNQLNSSI